jgi:hypothetical protein
MLGVQWGLRGAARPGSVEVEARGRGRDAGARLGRVRLARAVQQKAEDLGGLFLHGAVGDGQEDF